MSRPTKRANMNRLAERIPQFFKVFDATKHSNRLHIPSSFASRMKGNLPNKAFLTDKFSNMWPVELAKIKSQWYFGQGWTKVAQDISLEHEDYVLFQFDGDKIFYFEIIGSDSCEKVGVGCLKFNLEDHKLDKAERKGKGILQESELSCRDSWTLHRGRDEGQEEAASKPKKKRKANNELYGEDIIRSGLLVQPKNPYFVAKIRPNRRHELYVPVDVIKDFNLTLPKRINLRDPAGRTWLSDLSTWKDGRAFYIGGWDSFCRVNLIDDADKCVCEFVVGQEEPVMQIQIFRGQNAPRS